MKGLNESVGGLSHRGRCSDSPETAPMILLTLVLGWMCVAPALAAKSDADVSKKDRSADRSAGTTADKPAPSGNGEVGACCDPAVCFQSPQSQCPFNWVPQTDCGPVGTCCTPNGGCQQAAKACCEAGGGTFHTGDCQPPVTCCLPDRTCVETDPRCCADLQGAAFPNAPACSEPEACCFLEPGVGPSCKVMDPVCCQALFGMPQGPGSVCLGDSDFDFIDDACQKCDVLPNGPACSLTDCTSAPTNELCVSKCAEYDASTGQARVLECACQSPASCLVSVPAAGGEPFCTGDCGAGEECIEERFETSNGFILCCNCDSAPPTGSCCLDGTCFETTFDGCDGQGGSYGGDGSSCDGTLAACCLPSGECRMLDTECCRHLSGTIQPSGNACGAPEACCIAVTDLAGNTRLSCRDLDPLCCDEQGGTPQGAGTVCLGDGDGDNHDDACVPPVNYCPLPEVPGAVPLCLEFQTRDCEILDPTNELCLPRALVVTVPGQFLVEECSCYDPQACGPIRYDPANNAVFCPGPCPNPNERCQVHVNGAPSGAGQLDLLSAPADAVLTCDCAPPLHDPVRSALHNPANSDAHDPAQSDVHEVVLSIVHIPGDSALHNPLTSVVHDVWWTSMHNAADSVLHDPAASILHDPAKSEIHKPLVSAVHSPWMSINHDPAISDQHDGVTSGPHDVVISGVHDPATTSVHVPLTSDVHDPHWTSMHDVGLSPQHNPAVSVVHLQVNSDQHRPLTTDIHDPWWTSMHDGITSDTHDPVISPIHEQVASAKHDALTTDIHDPHWSAMHDPVVSEGHPVALSWIHRQTNTELHNLLTSDVHDPWWTSMHQPGQSEAHDAAVSWVHLQSNTELHQLLTSDIHDPWWTSMHHPEQSPVHDPARSPIHNPLLTQQHSIPFTFVHAPFMSPSHFTADSEIHRVGWSSIDHDPINSHNPTLSVGHHPLISLQHTTATSPIHGPVDSIIHDVNLSPVHSPTQSPVHIPGISPFHDPANTALHRPLRSDIHDPVWTSMHDSADSDNHDPARSGVHKLPLSPGHLPLDSVFHSPFMSANHDAINSPLHDPARSAVHQPGLSIQHDPLVSALHSPLLSGGHVITTSVGHLTFDSSQHHPARSVVHAALLSPAHTIVRSILHSPLLSAGHVATTSVGHLPADSTVHDPARSAVHDSILSVGHDVLNSVVHAPLMSAGHDPLISPVHDPARSVVHDAATSAQHDPLTSVFHAPLMSAGHIPTTSLGHDPVLSGQHDPALSLVHDPATTALHDPLTSIVHDPHWSTMHDAVQSVNHDPAISQIHDPILTAQHDPVRSAVHSVLMSAPHSPLTSVGHFADQSAFHDPALSAVTDVQEQCPLPPTVNQWCANLQQRDCQSDNPDGEFCQPIWLLITDPPQFIVEVCDCVKPDDCGAISISDLTADISCPGVCPDPNDLCQIHLNGNATGQERIDRTTLPANSIVTCDCAPPPPQVCPLPPSTGPGPCSNLQTRDCLTDDPASDFCLPRALVVTVPGQFLVDKCDCLDPDGCGPIRYDAETVEAVCSGPCPVLNDRCQVYVNGVATGGPRISLLDTSTGDVLSCDCAPPPPQVCPLPTGTAGGFCAALQDRDCRTDDPSNVLCVPLAFKVSVPGQFVVEECSCLDPESCGPIHPVPGTTLVECPGPCPNAGDRCQVFIDGQASGAGFVDLLSMQADARLTCECAPPTTGACCLPPVAGGPNVGCEELTQADCQERNGSYAGDGTSCAGTIDACCGPNGDCGMLDPVCCDLFGGTPELGESCKGRQACCLDNNECIDVDGLCCELEFGGKPLGPDTECKEPVKCCYRDGSCAFVDPGCCEESGGVVGGGDSCEPDVGCCLPNGDCKPMNRDCCHKLGGKFSENFCDDETVGCCLPNGRCVDMTRECCAAFGGEAHPNLCGPPEACCLPVGVPGGRCACIETDPSCCEAAGGEPMGAGSVCDDNTCERGPFIVHAKGGPGQTSPCTGYIDPRIENLDLNDLTPKLGIQSIVLVFSEEVFAPGGGEVKPAEFIVSETGGGLPPTVVSVGTADNVEFKIRLDRPITLREWTTIQAVVVDACGNPIVNLGDLGPGVREPDRVDYAALPGDTTQNSQTAPDDLIRFRQYIATGVNPNDCADHLFFDIDRDGAFPLPIDLIRFRQIIAGAAPATMSWAGLTLNNDQP